MSNAFVVTGTPGRCSYCRCTDARACFNGCTWVDPDSTVCSTCELFMGMERAIVLDMLVAVGALAKKDRNRPRAFEDAAIAFETIVSALNDAGFAVNRKPPHKERTGDRRTPIPPKYHHLLGSAIPNERRDSDRRAQKQKKP